MIAKKRKEYINSIFNKCEVTVNGTKPWDIKIYDDRFYREVTTKGSLGLGESYMNGWWECSQLDEFVYRLLINNIDQKTDNNIFSNLLKISSFLTNQQTARKAKNNAAHHYNTGNDFFSLLLDKNMIYSCGYWKNTCDLNTAQLSKLDLICRKLYLNKNSKFLDVGCGWGGLTHHVAKYYRAHSTGITASKEQAQLASEKTKNLPVKIIYDDYRKLDGSFDRIASVGMFEHVGYKNYRSYMKTIHKSLKKDGLFLLHTIGNNVTSTCGEPWLEKYIFPGGHLPSASQISAVAEGLFITEDWHNFGPDYAKTLKQWHKNLVSHKTTIINMFDYRFYRMYTYYLLSCAAAFRARKIQLWQIVFTKEGSAINYMPVR